MITGTFLDEITHDIPAQNWGAKEWALDFDAMKNIGIDTVILIRAGYKNMCAFNSKVLAKDIDLIPAPLDLVDVFLTEAERTGMKFFFGTYDSGRYWTQGKFEKEIDLNIEFCQEVINRYGHRKAFGGWYICHEIHTHDQGMMNVYQKLSSHLRSLKNVPLLMSPYIKGVKQFGAQAISLDQHVVEWEKVFSALQGQVDIVAFQDGQIDYHELPDYLKVNQQLAKKYGLTSWSNIETFDRDMPIKFPPADYRKIIYKMEQAQKAGIEKMITFEFSHFMSPYSIYPSAHQFYKRYQEWLNRGKVR